MMISTAETFGNSYSLRKPVNSGRIATGIKLRIQRSVSALQNLDLSQYPEIEQVKYVLLNILSNWPDWQIMQKRKEVYRLLSTIDQYLPYLSNMELTSRATSVARASGRSSTTVSGDAGKPSRAGKAQINKKNPKAKFSKDLAPPKLSGLTDYMPWLIIGGITLVVVLGGSKIAKR